MDKISIFKDAIKQSTLTHSELFQKGILYKYNRVQCIANKILDLEIPHQHHVKIGQSEARKILIQIHNSIKEDFITDIYSKMGTLEKASKYFSIPMRYLKIGPQVSTKLITRTGFLLQQRAWKRRCLDIIYRLNQECIYRKDWAFVFDTLTANPKHYVEIFRKGSTLWQKYRQRVEYSLDTPPEYIAVVEKGEKGGRLHYHVLWMIKELPPHNLRDPNSNKKQGEKREIIGFTHWHHGFQTPIAVRFGKNDYYGRRGWRWPWKINSEGKKIPITVSTPNTISRYLGKYLVKERAVIQEGDVQWRTKVKRKLGFKVLDKILTHNEQIFRDSLWNSKMLHQTLFPRKNRPSLQLMRLRTGSILGDAGSQTTEVSMATTLKKKDSLMTLLRRTGQIPWTYKKESNGRLSGTENDFNKVMLEINCIKDRCTLRYLESRQQSFTEIKTKYSDYLKEGHTQWQITM
jgi:hypothetical protein